MSRPRPRPWSIGALPAVVDNDGRIKVRGRGLLLAGGNSIGQTANQAVLATLICEAEAPFVERSTSTAGVPLEPNGDFRIDECESCAVRLRETVLLIRTSPIGAWFAAGIPGPADDD